MPTEIVWLIGILVGIFVLILSREIACWYFKINERIDLMKQNNQLLDMLVKNTQGAIVAEPPVLADSPPPTHRRNPLVS